MMTFARASLPSGRPFLRVVATGSITPVDGKALVSRVSPGGDDGAVPVLVEAVDPTISVPPESRPILGAKSFAQRAPQRLAVVTNNGPLRVLSYFIVRMQGAHATTKFFDTEASALAWLDEGPNAP